jgi:signal transduction histidine kinase
MKHIINKGLVSVAVFLVISLIILDVIVTHHNNQIIEENRLLQKQAEEIKVTVSQFAIVIIHNLDLGLRGYALFHHDRFLYPLKFALRDKDSILNAAEKSLVLHQYPLAEFYQLKDSINAYVDLTLRMKDFYEHNQLEELHRLANLDKGYHLWLQYERFARKIYAYEDGINEKAKERYYDALRDNYLVQVLLFLLCVPTILFTAFHTSRRFAIVEKLSSLEAEKAQLLSEQNQTLEKLVQERTKEIQAQNEEIVAQNEELQRQQEEISTQRDMLAERNEQLKEAQQIIQQQNDFLEKDIKEKTKELVEHNQQLEQFAFIAAHNLRAPVARILGLGQVLNLQTDNREEEKMIIDRLVSTTVELDKVIKDLNVILEIKSNQSHYLTTVNFNDELAIIKSNLANEIAETNAEILACFDDAPAIVTVKAYTDSILLNLISNALKYRYPNRKPVIQVKTYLTDDYICLSVSDNGLGIDMEHHKNNLFNLYKRFHFHVTGKGLGLYLTKTQVMALGGKIEVESTLNVGTTFKVYLKNSNVPIEA